jgi:hypothetical protein
MATSAVGAQVYEWVRQRAPGSTAQRRHRSASLPRWLALVLKVVVVGGCAFGAGFVGVIALRAVGWLLADSATAAFAAAARAVV